MLVVVRPVGKLHGAQFARVRLCTGVLSLMVLQDLLVTERFVAIRADERQGIRVHDFVGVQLVLESEAAAALLAGEGLHTGVHFHVSPQHVWEQECFLADFAKVGLDVIVSHDVCCQRALVEKCFAAAVTRIVSLSVRDVDFGVVP